MATANEIITAAFGKAGIYQPEQTVPPEDSAQGLAALNDYLNGLNARGAVFESVTLALGDTVPVPDQNIRDLKWALAGEMASQWGKRLEGKDAIDCMQADGRFVAAHTTIYPTVPDAGLRFMPSRRRW